MSSPEVLEDGGGGRYGSDGKVPQCHTITHRHGGCGRDLIFLAAL